MFKVFKNWFARESNVSKCIAIEAKLLNQRSLMDALIDSYNVLDLRTENTRLQNENNYLRNLLRECEWAGYLYDLNGNIVQDGGRCPHCYASSEYKIHEEGCELEIACKKDVDMCYEKKLDKAYQGRREIYDVLEEAREEIAKLPQEVRDMFERNHKLRILADKQDLGEEEGKE